MKPMKHTKHMEKILGFGRAFWPRRLFQGAQGLNQERQATLVPKTPKRVFFMCFVAFTAFVSQYKWSWTPLETGVASTLRGVSASFPSVVWASGSRNSLLRSIDAGATWQRLPNPTEDVLDFRDVDAIDERTAYALSIGNGPLSRIYKTTDAGGTWTLQFTNSDPKGFLDAMTFWDADHGVAVGDSVDGAFFILTTEDGGRTWSRVPPDRLPAALPNEGAFAASGTNVAVFGRDHVWFGTGAAARARVLRSTDRGRTWAIAETPLIAGPSAGIYSVAFRDPMHGVIVGGDYAKETEAIDNVAVTRDCGSTWTLVKERGLGGFRSVVAFVPGTAASFVAVGPRGADLSTDDGRSWSAIAGAGYHAFSFAPGGTSGWGVGGRGTAGRLAPTK
jgi:photosystem II stability/assembly factor-like uncharacterized protein